MSAFYEILHGDVDMVPDFKWTTNLHR